jgi:hypothetical protein
MEKDDGSAWLATGCWHVSIHNPDMTGHDKGYNAGDMRRRLFTILAAV